jgi:hypothetical protein
MLETTRVQSKLWRIYRSLNAARLTAEDLPSAGDSLALGHREGRTGLAFGIYTRAGLEYALRAYGTLARLEARGLGPIDVRLEMTDPYRPRIRLESQAFGGRPCIDLELHESPGAAVGLSEELGKLPVLYLESLLLQHPGKSFDWSRPPLPEQEYPGLALSAEILQLLLLLAKRVGVEALALRPSTFHAAWIYSRYFRFVDGRAQGRFEALRADRRLRPLWLLSWALELGCLRRDGEPVGFAPDAMAAPLSRRVALHFTGAHWRRGWSLGRAERHTLDWGCLRTSLPWERMPSGEPPASVSARLKLQPH